MLLMEVSIHVWGQGTCRNSLCLLPNSVSVCVCVCTQQHSLKTWFAHMYIRLSTSPRMKDRWHFFLMDSILCIYKQGNQQGQSQNIMQLPQTSEHTAQRKNFIPRRCHMLYKCLEYKHNKVEFTCFHKSKIFLFNCLWFPQDSGYWPCMILRSMGVDQYCSVNSYMASLPLCLLLPLPPSLML